MHFPQRITFILIQNLVLLYPKVLRFKPTESLLILYFIFKKKTDLKYYKKLLSYIFKKSVKCYSNGINKIF